MAGLSSRAWDVWQQGVHYTLLCAPECVHFLTARRSYRVTVAGHIGPAVAESFAPLAVTTANGETTISGERLDAAMLGGVLRTIERMGLELVAITSQVDGG
jgi:hypothetical protein